jgi:coproporphyrinogen III oxidase
MTKHHFEFIARHFEEIQQKACKQIAEADGQAAFQTDQWQKEIGEGRTSVLQNGHKVEKAAINFSKIKGQFTPEMAKIAGKKGNAFLATGASSIIHPHHPRLPIIHMNIRYFELDSGAYWYGGGIDLTPHYIDKKQAGHFHRQLKNYCEDYHPDFYRRFKLQADEYFYLPHRNETRGVGGIFFDHLDTSSGLSAEKLFDFVSGLGQLYPKLYVEILENHQPSAASKREKHWQALRRGRYVEFNLLHDRGTKFGIASGGNTESILLSMPPMAQWFYNFVPETNSEEANTLALLQKNLDWINLK